MRVIAGHYRSRPLLAPRGNATRPTSDRLRETLFNVLGPRVPGARFADLYAGSGAVGIEALSRGATHCLFVEQAPPALAALRKNLSNLALEGSATIDSRPAARALLAATKVSASYDIVFLDPPYEAASEYVSTLNLLNEHARFCWQKVRSSWPNTPAAQFSPPLLDDSIARGSWNRAMPLSASIRSSNQPRLNAGSPRLGAALSSNPRQNPPRCPKTCPIPRQATAHLELPAESTPSQLSRPVRHRTPSAPTASTL